MTLINFFLLRGVYAFLLISIAIGQIAYIFVEVDTFDFGSFVLLVFSVLALIHLLLSKPAIDIRALVLSVVWFTSIVLVRQSLSQLLSVGSFGSASWRYQVVVIGLGVLILLLALAPVANLSRRLTAAAERLGERWIRPLTWLLIIVMGGTVMILILNQITNFGSLQMVVVSQVAIVFGAIVASAQLFRSSLTPANDGANYTEDLQKWCYIGALAAVAFGFILLSSQISGDINPDGLSYLAIAERYADGTPVVRGYWSPLISWLMAPAITLGVRPLTVHIALSQLAAITWMLMTVLIARRWGISRYARVALAVLVLLISLTFGFFPITPDLLGAAVISFGFFIITDPDLVKRPVRNGMIFGVTIAISYYAKYYNLPFFIAFAPILLLLLIARGESKSSSFKLVFVSLLTAILLSLPWVAAQWSRYGVLTITTSAEISRAVVGPEFQRHECYRLRLCDTPQDVLFPWEDPQLQYYSNIGWSPFDSAESLRHQIRLIWRNALQWIEETPIGPAPIPSVLLIVLVSLAFISWGDRRKGYIYVVGLAAFGFYAGGYLLTYGFDFRYYFPILPFAWLAGFAAIDKGLIKPLSIAVKPRAAGLLKAMILTVPILVFSWFSVIQQKVQNEQNTCLEEAAEEMSEYLIPPTAGTGAWINHIAYYSGTPTHGVIPSHTPISEVHSQLESFDIQTFIAPAETELVETLLAKYTYSSIRTVEVCGRRYEMLRVPGE